MMPEVSRREWPFIIVLALLALLLSSLPYVVAAAATPKGEVFNGFVINPEDGYTYLAKMQQGAHGAWRFHLLFTPEPHEPIVIYLFYISLGHLAGWLSIEPLTMLHAARLVAGFALLLVIYHFIACFVVDISERRLAFFLAVFGSGLGWLALLLAGDMTVRGLTPIDFWLIEMYTFFMVMLFPHFSIAVILILLSFLYGLSYLETERWPAALTATASTLALSTIHPYMILVVMAALALFWLRQVITQRRLWLRPLAGFLLMGFAPVPLVAVQYTGLTENAVMAGWQMQNLSLSPPPVHYLIGYGVLFALALPGGWWAWQQHNHAERARAFSRWPLLPLWLLVVALLLYAPVVFGLQRRFIEGAHIPVAMLAAAGLRKVIQPALSRSRVAGWLAVRGYGQERFAGFAGLLLIGLTVPSTLLLLGQAFALATTSPGLRFSADEAAGVAWIRLNSAQDDAILSSYDIGGYVPAFTGRHSFMGHWTETVDVESKKALAEAFYQGKEGEELLRRYYIDYVFYGPREKAIGRALDNPMPYLEPVFSQGSVALFRVVE